MPTILVTFMCVTPNQGYKCTFGLKNLWLSAIILPNYKLQQGIADYIFPSLLTPIIPFPGGPICSKCISDRIIPSAAWRYCRLIIPFCSHCVTMHCHSEEKPPKLPLPRDFVTLPLEDRAMAIGNMHRNIGKDCTCDSGDILADRQTYLSQYFITAPAGEVIIRITTIFLTWLKYSYSNSEQL